MGRPIILGNGRLTVGLNESGLVHDFYYPYVGLDNLTTARSMNHKIGVWIDGHFSWLDSKEWIVDIRLDENSLISTCTWTNSRYQVVIKSNDFVDYKNDVFCRALEVFNNSSDRKSIRVFFHQVFEISRGGRSDTAMYVPHGNYILDYKGRVCLTISGQTRDDKVLFDQYSVGSYRIEGKAGTYMDAEDGELSCNNVEHGGVDSVIRFNLDINPNESKIIDYWIVASDSQPACERINNEFQEGLGEPLISNKIHWETWLSPATDKLHDLDPTIFANLKKSLMVIKAHTDARGGIIASCDSSIYNYGRDYYSYVWPRDGAYAMWPLIRLGYKNEPRSFFRFCVDVITRDGYMMHKYQPDRSIGSTWHPLIRGGKTELAIQEDETAIIIMMLAEYLYYSDDTEFVKNLYEDLVKKPAEFICNFIDTETGLPHASYDLWEEKFLTSTYTTAITYKGLLAASELAEKFGNNQDATRYAEVAKSLLDRSDIFRYPDGDGYRKGFLLEADGNLTFDDTLDTSSFYGIMMYEFYKPEESSELLVNAVKKLNNELINPNHEVGGMPRYTNDYYFRTSDDSWPNPWIITTLWLAQFYVKVNQIDKAQDIINWTHTKMFPSGLMSEQINPNNGAQMSVSPLVWSHAEYINTALDLHDKIKK